MHPWRPLPRSRPSSPHIVLFVLLLLITFSFFLPLCLANQNLQFSFPLFTNDPSLTFSNNSNVDQQALQVTRNSGSVDVANTSGQITYTNQRLQLWRSSYNYSASFNTSFLINIGPFSGGGTNATGGGMTFMLSSQPAIYYLPNSYGARLGLYNASSTQQQDPFVAIEFDTFKDSFDPDGNHVGIDVNHSVNSIVVESLSPHNVSLTDTFTDGGVFTSVWIDYDGKLFTMDIYLANQGSNLSTKPAVPVISRYPIDLRKYQLPQDVYVGFSASMGTILETHCVAQWSFTSTDFPSNRTLGTGVIVGITVGVVAIALLLVWMVISLVRRRRKKMKRLLEMEDLTNLHYGPQKFSYRDLRKATKGFSKECCLGQGGFGAVYKGELRSKSRTMEVAVKCLSQKSGQGEKEFKAEVMSMGRMRHKNLVQLLGWSYESSRLMLVYEYLPNRSLDKWIGQVENGMEVMGWENRFHVMKGVAAGLFYLHEEWEKVVIHRDLKPSNVMLDGEFNARIGDFGLAKLIDDMEQESAQTKTIAGTFGYIAPESMEQGIISKETDIYSLGAIAIELATGHRISIDFLHRLSQLLEESSAQEAADPQLCSFDGIQLELLLRLGLACCHPHPPARPCIRDVVHALSTCGSSPAMAAAASGTFSSSYARCIPDVQISDSSLAAVEINTGR